VLKTPDAFAITILFPEPERLLSVRPVPLSVLCDDIAPPAEIELVVENAPVEVIDPIFRDNALKTELDIVPFMLKLMLGMPGMISFRIIVIAS
jgi:hypothetical protein